MSNKWCYLLLLPLLVVTSSFVNKHALYLGVVHITMEQDITIQVKVFSDDLQAILQNDLGYTEVGAISSLCELESEDIQAYFRRTLRLAINDENIVFELKNCEAINDVHLLEFETKHSPTSWQTVAIQADFFMELFPTQSNVVQIQRAEFKRFGKMTLQAPTLWFEIE